MVSITLELSEDEFKELFKSSMKQDLFESYLSAKEGSDLMYVRDIRKMLNMAEVKNEETV